MQILLPKMCAKERPFGFEETAILEEMNEFYGTDELTKKISLKLKRKLRSNTQCFENELEN